MTIRRISQYSDDLNRLYSGPFDDFVKRRTLLARALRKAGKRSEASFVQKLPKPAFSAWLVNRVYWHEADLFQRLLEAGDGLRKAQKEFLPGQGLSSLQHTQRKVQEAIDSLLGTAQEETVRMERPFTTQTEQRFIRTLAAIAQVPQESFNPPLGRFVEDLMPAGFDTLLELAASLPKPGKAVEKQAARSSTGGKVNKQKRLSKSSRSISSSHRSRVSARARLEKRVLRARENRDKAVREVKEASLSLQGVTRKQRGCREEMDTLADQLSVLKKEIRQIESWLETARKQHDRKARRLEKAEQDLAKARERIKN